MAANGSLSAALGRAIGLGMLSGSRTFTPLAALSRAAALGQLDGFERTPLTLLVRPAISRMLWLAAGGEWVGDKLPMIPSRLSPVPLTGRIVIGAVVGAASFRIARLPTPTGFAVGAASAAAGAYAAFTLRQRVDALSGWPDPVVGAAEDAMVISGSLAVCGAPWLGFGLAAAVAAALRAIPAPVASPG